MKTSVLVIAHDEERYIGACLASVLDQTRTADQIVLIAHNCTDRTEAVAREYPGVRVVPYEGPAGAIQARIRGFEEVTGDIVLCTDGDSQVPRAWVERLSQPFADERIAGVSGVVAITGVASRNALTTFWNFHAVWLAGPFIPAIRPWPFWGASFGVRRSAYERIGGLAPLLEIREKLALATCPDDFYLSIRLRQAGRVPLVFGVPVRVISKEKSGAEDLARARIQRQEGWRLYRYLQAHRASL